MHQWRWRRTVTRADEDPVEVVVERRDFTLVVLVPAPERRLFFTALRALGSNDAMESKESLRA